MNVLCTVHGVSGLYGASVVRINQKCIHTTFTLFLTQRVRNSEEKCVFLSNAQNVLWGFWAVFAVGILPASSAFKLQMKVNAFFFFCPVGSQSNTHTLGRRFLARIKKTKKNNSVYSVHSKQCSHYSYLYLYQLKTRYLLLESKIMYCAQYMHVLSICMHVKLSLSGGLQAGWLQWDHQPHKFVAVCMRSPKQRVSPFTGAILSNVLSELCHFQMKSGEFQCNKRDKQVAYNPAHYSKLFIKAGRNSLPQEIYSVNLASIIRMLSEETPKSFYTVNVCLDAITDG